MKKIYILIPILSFFITVLWAQPVMKLQVDSPASIEGTYFVQHATFGYDCEKSISGEAKFIDDGTDSPTIGCSPAQNDLSGKIAFIDRGGCNFSLKAWNAQEAGAIAVVICNSNPDGTFVMIPGLHGDEMTIHTVMMSQRDCKTIRAEIPGANMTLEMYDVIPELTPVLWTEDFDDGMTGWSTTTLTNDDEIFFWSDSGFTTIRGATVKLGMPASYCTGAVGFPGGWYQSGMTGIDSLAAPGPPYPDYDAELISPLIDLSGVDKPISLKFDQLVRKLNANTSAGFTFISYSINGGETYSDPISVNAELETFDRVHSTIKINIPEIQGQSEVRIKFIFAMDYYYWIIDNVRLVEREDNNLEATTFFAVSPYTHIPISQVEPIYFVGDIANTGAKTQENVKFNIAINKDGQELHSETLDFGSIEGDSIKENEIFTNSFTPQDLGVYAGVYTVSGDAVDFDASDNTRSFSFEVTDTLFAKESGRTRQLRPRSDTWVDGNPHNWAIGNVYHINNDKDANDLPLTCKSIIVGISNSSVLTDQSILVFLYKWDDTDNNGNADPGELVEVGGTGYVFSGTEEDGILLELLLDNSLEDDKPIRLQPNQDYIAMVQYSENTPDDDSDDIFYEASEENNYRAQLFLNTPTDVAVESFTGGIINYGFGIGEARYGTVVGILNDAEGTFNDVSYATNYFNMDITPVIRMVIVPDTDVANDDLLSSANKVALYPNPTSDILNVQIDLEEIVGHARINIVDITGKVIFKKDFKQLKTGNFQFKTDNLANGIYQLNLVTSKGARANKFVVNR